MHTLHTSLSFVPPPGYIKTRGAAWGVEASKIRTFSALTTPTIPSVHQISPANRPIGSNGPSELSDPVKITTLATLAIYLALSCSHKSAVVHLPKSPGALLLAGLSRSTPDYTRRHNAIFQHQNTPSNIALPLLYYFWVLDLRFPAFDCFDLLLPGWLFPSIPDWLFPDWLFS